MNTKNSYVNDTLSAEDIVNIQPELTASNRSKRLIKRGIWVYFFLLIFEGALRKWFLPSLATPLLIVRDPVALWLLLMVWYRGRLPINTYVIGMITIAILGIFTATLAGHGSLPVALYGARIFLLHFPLLFIIGGIFNFDDVINLGKVLLVITLPMTVLIGLQFFSPQSAWVNLGLAGDTAGAGFSGANGYFRPPGTFSFITGTVSFYSLVACFIFYFWLNYNRINKWLLTVATICLLAAIPLSISRSLSLQVGVTIIFTVVASVRKPQFIGRLILSLIGLVIIVALLSQTDFFRTSAEAFLSRFESANESGGGFQGAIIDRFFDGLLSALSASSSLPPLGYGLGMGTNVGAQLIYGNRAVFLITEGEWGRTVGELGPVLGLVAIFIRLSLVVKLLTVSYKKMKKGEIFPWLLLSFGLLVILQGQWAQPTVLGFSTLTGGLVIATLRSRNGTNNLI